MIPVIITPAAEADLAEAIEWYHAIRPGIEEDFRLCFDEVLDRIRHYPQSRPVLARNIRRALLHRFSYAVYYVDQNTAISVVAVLHTSRDPRMWLSRGH